MTRVAVDLLFYTGKRGGMESYVRELYSAIPPYAADTEFVAFASAELAALGAPWFPGTVVDSGIRGENRIAWALGELTAVSRFASRIGADVIHSPANLGPWRSRARVVVTTHDLLPFRHPEYVPGRYAPILRLLMRGVAVGARRILTISEASKHDLVRYISGSAAKVDVVPLAGSGLHSAERPGLRHPDLLLALGNRAPQKNFEGLIRAMACIDTATRPRLIITGSHGVDPLAPLVRELALDRWVTLAGWVSSAELEHHYAEATAVVVPSFFEGFGLPVLEAMSRGCPVLCSDIPPLREVAGDAALFFDPHDPRSIASTITRALADQVLLDRLASDGHARAAQFSWARTAELTAQSLLRAAGPESCRVSAPRWR